MPAPALVSPPAAGDRPGEDRLARLVDGELAAAERDRPRGAAQPGQGLAVAVEIEGPAGHGEDPGRGETPTGAQPQRAGVDLRAAGVGLGGGEDQRAGIGLGQPAGAADDPGEGRRRSAGNIEAATAGPERGGPHRGEVGRRRQRA